MLELPFQNETFDVVCSNELIEHVPDVETALAEMIRVTRKGGRIIICGPNLCSPTHATDRPNAPDSGETRQTVLG